MRLTGAGGEGADYVPFFVQESTREGAGGRCVRCAVVHPTSPYGNERHWWTSPAVNPLTGSTTEELSTTGSNGRSAMAF